MLNLFAASGHINYAKSARLYLQEMEALQEKHPWLHNNFENGLHAVRRTGRHWAGLWSDLIIEQTLMRSIKSRGGLTRGRGMTESVRHMWVLSLNYSAAIHEAMTSLSGLTVVSSEQHIEMGVSRRARDFDDSEVFIQWFKKRNPFAYNDSNLHSLSTGLVSVSGKDEVNCEKAEQLGRKIQVSLDNLTIMEATIKRSDQLRPLDYLCNTVKVEKHSVYINPTVLFTRLAAIAQSEENVEQYFEYELTTNPMSLFKNGMMRKADKPSLRKVLLKDGDRCSVADFDKSSIFVVDGGALLHRVRWSKGLKFKDIQHAYVRYVRRHYGSAFIVFDGYGTATTKGSEHARRQEGKTSQTVVINEENEVPYAQDVFLSSESNKIQLINLISNYLTEDGQRVHICEGDADTKIVSTALELAEERNDHDSVVVVADDTDVAVMLLYHWTNQLGDIFFLQEKDKKVWNIKAACRNLELIKDDLLFIHAWSGCDTTSSTFGKGKASFLNQVKKSDKLRLISKTMSGQCSNQIEIGNLAVAAFKIVYGGKSTDSLMKMRYALNIYFIV
jgi:hypothetical protein